MRKLIYIIPILILTHTSCEKYAPINSGLGQEDWTAESHGPNASPDYQTVFDQNKVHRLDIVIEPEYWEVMQSDLASLMSTNGFTDESPIYVPCQMFYNEKKWCDVGIRYKGNSSLKNAFSQGIGKLPLRIEMDHFENENPNISGQTFYGFRQLSLSSNFKDGSFMHEKVASDLFREFGIPAAQTAFYRIYVDHGDGPIYFGLYTMVEVVFDSPMLNTQLGGNNGNCYKPDFLGARLNDPTAIDATYFPNKTNAGSDRSDIEELITRIISDTRLNNPTEWRSQLEEVIDMDLYLKYLAANTTIKNWDTYGRMTHNYYLYNNPITNKFNWIPWDNNEAFSDGPGGGGPGGPGGGGPGGPGGGGDMSPLEFDFSNIETMPLSSTGDVAWPMISYVYADPIYKLKYDTYIDEFISTVFTVNNVNTKFNSFHNMIQPYVTGNEGEIPGYTHLISASEFDQALTTLTLYISTRIQEADAYTP